MTDTDQTLTEPSFQERCCTLADVVERFLKRQASIGELRAAVRALRGSREAQKKLYRLLFLLWFFPFGV